MKTNRTFQLSFISLGVFVTSQGLKNLKQLHFGLEKKQPTDIVYYSMTGFMKEYKEQLVYSFHVMP